MNRSHSATLAFDVRDYECDLQGIVNNAVYQHYLEHARHQYLKQHGFDFAALTTSGVHLVVIRAEIDYKSPLRSGETFVVESRLERVSPVKFAFLQTIRREQTLVLTATIVCAATDATGKPIFPTALEPLFERLASAT